MCTRGVCEGVCVQGVCEGVCVQGVCVRECVYKEYVRGEGVCTRCSVFTRGV